ncbi:MAG: DNA repair protein RadC [Desulfobacterales bacterium]|nr:DNA repair protein RadC [Desulfobacterales bacterium]
MSKKKEYSYIKEIEIRYRKKRIKNELPTDQALTDAQKVFELFSDLQNETREKMIAISLDSSLKIICFEVVAVGSVLNIYIRPFEAIRSSVALNAHGLIIVHNHPSGDPEPTDKDMRFTEKLKEITNIGGMKFHDHIIIGDNKYYSFSEKGLLN